MFASVSSKLQPETIYQRLRESKKSKLEKPLDRCGSESIGSLEIPDHPAS